MGLGAKVVVFSVKLTEHAPVPATLAPELPKGGPIWKQPKGTVSEPRWTSKSHDDALAGLKDDGGSIII